MAKLREFVLEGEAFLISARLNNEKKPSYMLDIRYEFAGSLTSEELRRFTQAATRDTENWEGILHRFPEDKFTYSVLAKFEEAWGGNGNGIRLQAAPEAGV